jgi:hypothetical protein
VRTANDPVRRPATAAPAITVLDGLIILFQSFLSLFGLAAFANGTVVVEKGNEQPIYYLCARRQY